MLYKKFLLFFKLSILFVIVCSCSNSTSEFPDGLVIGSMTATIDKKPWKSQQSTFYRQNDGKFLLMGISMLNNNEIIKLYLNSIEVGTHTDGIGEFIIHKYKESIEVFSNSDVTITITASSDTEVSGSYSFIASNNLNFLDTRIIENGSFTCKLLIVQ